MVCEKERLHDPDGKLASDKDNILKGTRNFYRTLYTAEPTDPQAQAKLFTNIESKITDEQNDALASDITHTEILQALTQMHNGKSQGSDGLPTDLYKTFSSLLIDDLLELYNYIFSSGRMAPSQRT